MVTAFKILPLQVIFLLTEGARKAEPPRETFMKELRKDMQNAREMLRGQETLVEFSPIILSLLIQTVKL